MRPSTGPGSKPCVFSASWAARVSVMATRSWSPARRSRCILPLILSFACCALSLIVSFVSSALSLIVCFVSTALSLIVSLVSTALSLTSAAEAGPSAHVAVSASAQANGINLCIVHLLLDEKCKSCTSSHRTARVAVVSRQRRRLGAIGARLGARGVAALQENAEARTRRRYFF